MAGPSMRTTTLALIGVLALAMPAGCGDDDESGDGTTEAAGGTSGTETDGATGPTGGSQQGFRAQLRPLNGSGASGTAIFSQLGSTLRVQITARGLAAGEEHPQHVHRLEDGAPGECPTEVQDQNGDGIVSAEEAEQAYGPVALELAPFPSAGGDGGLSFQGTFDLEPELEPLSDRVVVLHGIEAGGDYDATVPVACGRIG